MKEFAPELQPTGFVMPKADGSFSFSDSEDGVAVLLLQVWSGNDLLDVIAWQWGRPSPWWMLRRAATYLGHAELERRHLDGKPIRVVGTPQDWLRDGGHAICVLDWSAPLSPLLRGQQVICTTSGLQRRLDAKLRVDTCRRGAA
jgi:hypothetical protein